MKAEVERGRQEIYALHRAGGGGLEVVRLNADLMDGVVRRIHRFCLEEANRKGDAVDGRMALVALGGYGRRELNPQSDVDLLFLYCTMSPIVDFLAKETLHLLWDLGLRVGHSCRSVQDCIRIAAGDSTVKTSMIECRHICGDEEITGRLIEAVGKKFLAKRAENFIKAKMSEQEERYEQYGDSSNCQEPHVKEGMGGLRDCHVATWCAIARYGAGGFDDFERLGILTAEELQGFKEAYSFLHRVRNELHFMSKQRSDVIFMEVQRDVAANLGYESDGFFPAVELFMKDYFLRARDNRRYSRLVLDRCCRRGGGFAGLSRLISKRKVDDGLYSLGGELMVEGDPFKERPILLLRLFEYCQTLGLTPCQGALRSIRQSLHMIDHQLINSAEARDLFLTILSGDGAAGALAQMHDAGVLGKYIPEFGELTCLAQHDLYHRYTVDEHVLQALKHLEDLKSTEEPELKELSSLYKRVHKPWLLKLAVLLHDIGKIKGRRHVESGEAIVSRIVQRWNLEEEDRRRLLLLVKLHLTMSHLSQRRNIGEEKMVAAFARNVENEENLILLYLLTYADARGVGPHVWTTWKGALLWELYHETHNYFVRGGKGEYHWEDMVEQARGRVLTMAGEGIDLEEVEHYFHAMPYRYLISTPPERLARHLALVHSSEYKTISLDYTHDSLKGYTELVVCTKEKPGLFSRIAGTLSAMNINITSAQIYTGTDGSVFDILQVNGLDGKPVTDHETWDKVRSYLTMILEGELTVEQLMQGRKKPLQARKAEHMEVSPTVSLDNSSSDTHTIVEVLAQDRLGLLYLITNILFAEGANIYLAKISTEAHRAINAFYITDFEGRKIEDKKVLNGLKHKLLKALLQGD